MKKLLAILIILSLLTSCCRRNIHTSVKYEVRDSISITTQKRFVDTTLHIDSSVSVVKIICDSNNKPQIVSNKQVSGKRTISVRTNSVQNGSFTITCPADSLRLIIAYQDSIIRSYRAEKTDTTIVVEQKKGFWANIKEILAHLIYTLVALFTGALLYVILKR
jgi:hypothetical protein